MSAHERDVAYLLGCLKTHADKFPAPSHMMELLDRLNIQSMAANAARYRVIRNPPYSNQYGDLYAMTFQGDGDMVLKGEALDKAADAALQAKKGDE